MTHRNHDLVAGFPHRCRWLTDETICNIPSYFIGFVCNWCYYRWPKRLAVDGTGDSLNLNCGILVLSSILIDSFIRNGRQNLIHNAHTRKIFDRIPSFTQNITPAQQLLLQSYVSDVRQYHEAAWPRRRNHHESSPRIDSKIRQPRIYQNNTIYSLKVNPENGANEEASKSTVKNPPPVFIGRKFVFVDWQCARTERMTAWKRLLKRWRNETHCNQRNTASSTLNANNHCECVRWWEMRLAAHTNKLRADERRIYGWPFGTVLPISAHAIGDMRACECYSAARGQTPFVATAANQLAYRERKLTAAQFSMFQPNNLKSNI